MAAELHRPFAPLTGSHAKQPAALLCQQSRQFSVPLLVKQRPQSFPDQFSGSTRTAKLAGILPR